MQTRENMQMVLDGPYPVKMAVPVFDDSPDVSVEALVAGWRKRRRSVLGGEYDVV